MTDSVSMSEQTTAPSQAAEAHDRATRTKSKLFALQDILFKWGSFAFAMMVLVTLIGIVIMLVQGAMPVFDKFGLGFITDSAWDPNRDVYGAWPSLMGSLSTALIAMLIAVPIGFGIAIYLTELAPVWIRRPIGIAIELLAAIPSIVYGMWGLFFFAPWFAVHVQPGLVATFGALPVFDELFKLPLVGGQSGISVLTAGIVLAFMSLPFIAAIIRDVFEVVPGVLKESAYGIGATTWEVIWHVVLPYTKVGVVGGVILGFGRAIGETLAVTFVIGNATALSASLLQPGSTIASRLANEFNEADGLHLDALVALGLLLFIITFIILMFSKLLLARLAAVQEGKST